MGTGMEMVPSETRLCITRWLPLCHCSEPVLLQDLADLLAGENTELTQ